ncbi:MAG: MoaD/ThiS family protein [Muribaculaceae bacterium]|nr:MoaD/ThiS family protein [Muribaculaceae bacterium]
MITIKLNNVSTDLPNDYINLEELLEWKRIPTGGTAVAVNNKVVKHENWPLTTFNDGDNVVMISAAVGG